MFGFGHKPVLPFEFREAPVPGEGIEVMLTVDTEAEFDWNAPRTRTGLTAENLLRQGPVLEACREVALVPTFLFDVTCTENPAYMDPFVSAAGEGRLVFGAHPHAWSTPPLIEELTGPNSYMGNLPVELETAKLRHLTEALTRLFGAPPRVHRSGRYGIGPNTPEVLAALGYGVDLSINALHDFSADGGPDFSHVGNAPLLCGRDGRVLSIPTTGFRPNRWRRRVLRLSPESASVAEIRRAAERLLRAGTRVFVLTYHSSSLLPGGSPYARTEDDCRMLIASLKNLLHFFIRELGARPTDPLTYARRCGVQVPGL